MPSEGATLLTDPDLLLRVLRGFASTMAGSYDITEVLFDLCEVPPHARSRNAKLAAVADAVLRLGLRPSPGQHDG